MTAAPSLPPVVGWVEFEGPLDLLLDEVRRQNVDIERIQMAPLVARFLGYVQAAGRRNLNLDIEWLHTASILIQWKSRSLLPHEPTAEPTRDTIRDELIGELRQYRKEAAKDLARRLARTVAQLPRGSGREQFTEPAGPEEPEDLSFTSVWDLLGQARELARWAVEHREDRRRWHETFDIEQETMTVAEMSELLRAALACSESGTLDGVRLIHEQITPARRAYVFLGMLEMARAAEVNLSQEQPFGEIWVSSHARMWS